MPEFEISPQNGRSPGELTFGVELDSVKPFAVDSSGKVSWGSGSAARDVTLERSGAGVLNVTGTLNVNGVPVGGGGGVSSVDTGFVTSGDVSAIGASFTQVGTDLTIAAAAGDLLVLTIDCLCNSTAIDIQFEAATRVAGADANYWSSGAAASRFPGGLGSWYVTTGFVGPHGSPPYHVQAGDLVAGNVTVRAYVRSTGGARTVFQNASYPVVVRLDNYGQ